MAVLPTDIEIEAVLQLAEEDGPLKHGSVTAYATGLNDLSTHGRAVGMHGPLAWLIADAAATIARVNASGIPHGTQKGIFSAVLGLLKHWPTSYVPAASHRVAIWPVPSQFTTGVKEAWRKAHAEANKNTNDDRMREYAAAVANEAELARSEGRAPRPIEPSTRRRKSTGAAPSASRSAAPVEYNGGDELASEPSDDASVTETETDTEAEEEADSGSSDRAVDDASIDDALYAFNEAKNGMDVRRYEAEVEINALLEKSERSCPVQPEPSAPVGEFKAHRVAMAAFMKIKEADEPRIDRFTRIKESAQALSNAIRASIVELATRMGLSPHAPLSFTYLVREAKAATSAAEATANAPFSYSFGAPTSLDDMDRKVKEAQEWMKRRKEAERASDASAVAAMLTVNDVTAKMKHLTDRIRAFLVLNVVKRGRGRPPKNTVAIPDVLDPSPLATSAQSQRAAPPRAKRARRTAAGAGASAAGAGAGMDDDEDGAPSYPFPT